MIPSQIAACLMGRLVGVGHEAVVAVAAMLGPSSVHRRRGPRHLPPVTAMNRSAAEDLVELWLKDAGIPYVAQWRFHPTRRWRFDFAIGEHHGTWKMLEIENRKLAIEVEGGQWTGGHKRGDAADSDCEKFNTATLMGWKVLRFTTNQVNQGLAWKPIHQLWAGETPG